MKILISSDGPGAHFYERIGTAHAAAYAGYDVRIFDNRGISVFDQFDDFMPDVFIGQAYNLNPSLVQVFTENPEIQLYFKVGDWSPESDNYDLTQYQILVADDIQKAYIHNLAKICKKQIVVGCHYRNGTEEETHKNWESLGVKLHHNMLGCDVFKYTNSTVDDRFKCQIGLVSGRWPYKSKVFSKWLDPLFNPNYNYNIKIFGNNWPGPYAMGVISDEDEKTFLKSSDITINLHEPHMILNHEINERTWKLGSNKCFCVSDVNRDLEQIFNNHEIAFARNPDEFKNIIDHYLRYPEEKQEYIDRYYNKVINNHTYFHRLESLFRSGFGLEKEADHVLDSYENVKKELNL